MFQPTLGRCAPRVAYLSKLSQAFFLIALASVFSSANAQDAAQISPHSYSGGRGTRTLVVEPINEGKLVTLAGNTHGGANAANDRGAVSDNLPMEHMQLVLQRPPELEQDLVSLIDEQQKKGSPEYHHWLTAKDFGDRFGVSQQDIATVSNWLENHGFRVDSVPTSGMMIEFSGTAGQVKQAFHTEIHNLEVNGEAHIANMSDPQIPAALTGVVKGVHALHNFMPHSMLKPRPQFTYDCTIGTGNDDCASATTFYAVGPQDLATIYNLNPAFSKGNTGAGQTVVVIEDTLLANVSDVATFRSAFGLSGYSGTFSQMTATGSTTCTNSGVNGDEGEAALDAEWAGASAPGASIVLASCADTSSVFGGLIALQNLINGATPPPIVSISYGECESSNGATANASYVTTYQQAAAEGTSVFVSAGDEGAASCDANLAAATHGIAVSGFASTPYNVAVGGTDFADVYANAEESGPALSTYWGASNNAGFGSALSYIPEIPWNDSCASQLIYSFPLLDGGTFSTGYGSSGFCNSTVGKADYRTTGAGSGGPSTYSNQPSWQTVLGLPTSSGGKRYLPDVSLFAANGVFNHFYEYCLSDAAQGGVPCTYTNAEDAIALAAGGTSFSSPIMAGIQALINQTQVSLVDPTGQQGNPAQRLYALGNIEYGTTGSAACNSSLGTGVGSSCVFYDVTLGDIDVNCSETRQGATVNCFGASGTGSAAVDGVLSTSNTTLGIAYGATSGWDFATGLGTVNVSNLIANWSLVQTTTAVTSNLNPSSFGNSVTLTATITGAIGSTETGTVSWSSNTGCAPSTVSEAMATCVTTSLPVGSDTLTATYAGDTNYAGSSGSFTETVQLAPEVTSASSATFLVGTAGSFSVTTQGASVSISETGALPAGVTFIDNGNGTATISGTPAANTGGTYPIVISLVSGASGATQNFTLIVDQAPAITSAASATFSVGAAGSFVVTTSGYPTSALSETGSLPAGLSFTDNRNATATISGTPAALTGLAYALTISASNGTTNATQSFTLAVDQAPVFVTGTTFTFSTSGTGADIIRASAYPAPTYSYTGTLPSGITFTSNSNGTATLSGRAAANTGGTYPITLIASNGLSPNATQNVTVVVNQSVEFTSAAYATFNPGVAGSFTVTTTGYPAPSFGISGSLPTGVSFTDNGNGTALISGTPVLGTSGAFFVTINANNGVSTPSQGFTLTVAPPQYQLTTAANPAAGGTVTPASGSVYSVGTVVPLVATPAAGYAFIGWTSAGDPVASASSASTTITVNGTESVTAEFSPSLVVSTTADDSGDATKCTPQSTPGANPVDSACSLRDALLSAASAGGASISFSGTVFNSGNSAQLNTITLSNGTLTVPSNTSITGPTNGSGASLANVVIVNGNAASTVFTVGSGITGVSLSGLTITNGSSAAGVGGAIDNNGVLTVSGSTISGSVAAGNGGGIFNQTGSALTLTNSTVSGNQATAIGGGIYSNGTLALTSTTIAGNAASEFGGGVYSDGVLTVIASTISGNSATIAGGGIVFGPSGESLGNTIVAGNTAGADGDVVGSYTNNGGNVVGGSAGLAALANYGGPTQTMPALPGAAAICGGTLANVGGLSSDERGLPRSAVYGSTPCIDSGAVQTNYALAFMTEPPSSASTGVAVTPATVVTLTESGVVFPPATGTVTMTDTAGALAVSGTNSAALSAGSATFGNLIFSLVESNDTLMASLSLNAGVSVVSAPSTGVNITSGAPAINAVSAILPQQTQTITISGAGFGTQAGYAAGDSPYIELVDSSGAPWAAGHTGNGVTLGVSSWSDSQIVITGISGNYGTTHCIRPGDQLSVSVWNAQTGTGPAVYSIVASGGTDNCPTVISSVSPIISKQTQTITISGGGFGTQAAYTGDSNFIELSDSTGSPWNAGYTGNGVSLAVSSWTDSQIVLSGLGGSYGSAHCIRPGDHLSVRVWNAQTGVGPAVYSIVASAGTDNCPTGITSVSPIVSQQTQTFTITGAGFGTQAAYSGDSSHMELADNSRAWFAGNTGNLVGLAVSSWSDTQIVITGLTGSYGSNGWCIGAGDQLSVKVWNAQTGAGPAVYSVVATSGSGTCP